MGLTAELRRDNAWFLKRANPLNPRGVFMNAKSAAIKPAKKAVKTTTRKPAAKKRGATPPAGPKEVMQFKIEMRYIVPKIWRRIQVPADYTFFDLHAAITNVIGWFDYHLHEFEIKNPITRRKSYIGYPPEEAFETKETLAGWELALAQYFGLGTKKALYSYDFGDDWKHDIIYEKTLPADPSVIYPICLEGERLGPPEDCGGIPGYMALLEALKKPKSERAKEILEWLGHEYDPDSFDPAEVEFDNPTVRLVQALSHEDPFA
jgi:hypothetical protein